MSKSKKDSNELYGRYLTGLISGDEADELLSRLRHDSESVCHLKNMLWIDWLLRIRFGMVDRLPSIPAIPAVSEESVSQKENPVSDNLSPLPPSSAAANLRQGSKIQSPEIQSPVSVSEENEEDELSHLFHWNKNAPVVKRKSDLSPSRRSGVKKVFHSPKITVGSTFALVVCSLLLILLIGSSYWYELTRTKTSEVREYIPVARIIEMIDPQWPDDAPDYRRGQCIDTGRVELLAGKVMFQTDKRAEIVLEGPGNLTFNHGMSVYSTAGKISVRVPKQAVGFILTTPFGQIIDKGTEFFVHAGQESADVNIIKGKVEVHTPEANPILLNHTGSTPSQQSRGVSLAKGGLPVVRLFSQTDYIPRNEFQEELARSIQKQKAARCQAGKELDRQSGILVRFDLQMDNIQSVGNKAIFGKNLCSELQLEGARLGEGQWQGTGAVNLMKSDSASFSLGGQYRSMTIMASIRVDRDKLNSGVILSSENQSNNTGRLVWQITETGQFQLQLTDEITGNIRSYYSKPFYNRNNWETWRKVAVVIDTKNNRISFYANGKIISTEVMKYSPILNLTRANIGNLIHNGKIVPKHRLKGFMDEIVLFDHALSMEQMAQWK